VSSLLATADPFASIKEQRALKLIDYRTRQKEALQKLSSPERDAKFAADMAILSHLTNYSRNILNNMFTL